jgi:DNA-binding transcriptional ArsR family regulator
MVGFTQSRKFDRVKMTSEELLEVYNLETIEQMRAIADQLRQRIMQELLQEPRTATQVAEVLGLAPAKVHYHIRELERVGLVNLVFTREKGGILEKYFQPIARNLFVDEDLLQHTPPEEYIELANRLLGDVRTNFVNALSRSVSAPPEHDFMTLRLGHIWITPDEFTQLKQELAALEQRFQQRRGLDEEREVSLVVVANEPGPVHEIESAEQSGSTQDLTPHSGAGAPKPHKTWAAGAFRWDADALETSLARGETLDITVLGVCTFDGNVSADLANRAISHFSLVGKLVAPPEVREVLKTKE